MTTSNSADLLDETTVVPYLRDRGIISGDVEVEILTGGVSNVVLGIRTSDSDLVLKQALPQLKTKIEWLADQKRAITEARAIKILHSVTPKNIPVLVDVDPIEFTLTMTRCPRDFKVWKSELLEGNIDPTTGYQLGAILAAWHNFGFNNQAIQDQFQEDILFGQLRVQPFYGVLRDKNPKLASKISSMMDQITKEKLTIVHGDYSPKNVMVANDMAPIALDFEVIHVGNPVFDLGFLLAHLICKNIRATSPDQKSLLKETALKFVDGYQKNSLIPVAHNFANHAALVALARVDGVSPVNYLEPAGQELLRTLTIEALSSEKVDILELFP